MRTCDGSGGAVPHRSEDPPTRRHTPLDLTVGSRRPAEHVVGLRSGCPSGEVGEGSILEPRVDGPCRRLGQRLGRVHRALPVVVVGVTGYAVLTLATLGAGFLMVEFGVDSWVGAVDATITRWLARHRTFPFGGLTSIFSTWADTWTVVMAALGAGVVLLACRCWRQALVLAVGLPLELAVFLSVTYLVGRPRPSVPKPDSVPATASFPSGHITAAVVLYGGLALIVWSLTRSRQVHVAALTAAVAMPLAVGVARVYRGLHYPTDVLAGAALGTSCLVVAVLAARSLPLGGSARGGSPAHAGSVTDDGAAPRHLPSDR